MKINYNMDKITFYKILLLKRQCKTYLMLARLTPNTEYYHSQAVKTLQVAKVIYNNWLENSTNTIVMAA